MSRLSFAWVRRADFCGLERGMKDFDRGGEHIQGVLV
jgi:hypothetical protein